MTLFRCFFLGGRGGGGGGALSAQNFSAPTKTQGPPVPPTEKNPSYATASTAGDKQKQLSVSLRNLLNP